MNNGWIKWHLQSLDNDMFRDDWTAWHLFEYLCLMAYKGKPQGTVVTGRDKIANAIGGNSSTIYKALTRLKNAKMVTVSVAGRKSIIRICNWSNYQYGGNSSGNSSVTVREQFGNTLIKNKNKNKINNNVEIQSIYDYYIQKFDSNPNKFKLTAQRKIKIGLRLKDVGKENLIKAIDNVSESNFHRGENDRNWKADLDFIIRSYEQVEKLANMGETRKIIEFKI